jgi:hypothetical protein
MNQSIAAGTNFEKGTNHFIGIKLILQDILYKVAIRSVKGNTNIEVKNLQIDSQKDKQAPALLR